MRTRFILAGFIGATLLLTGCRSPEGIATEAAETGSTMAQRYAIETVTLGCFYDERDHVILRPQDFWVAVIAPVTEVVSLDAIDDLITGKPVPMANDHQAENMRVALLATDDPALFIRGLDHLCDTMLYSSNRIEVEDGQGWIFSMAVYRAGESYGYVSEHGCVPPLTEMAQFRASSSPAGGITLEVTPLIRAGYAEADAQDVPGVEAYLGPPAWEAIAEDDQAAYTATIETGRDYVVGGLTQWRAQAGDPQQYHEVFMLVRVTPVDRGAGPRP